MTDLSFDGGPNDTPIGYFTYDVDDDHWSWSDGMFVLHGYQPREVPPTTELLLRHKHPDDKMRTVDVLESVLRNGRPFSCYHRVIDSNDDLRHILAVGRGRFDSRGKVEQVTGFFVDLTAVTQTEGEPLLLPLRA